MIIKDPRCLAFMVLSENETGRIPLDRILINFEEKFNLLPKRDRSLANAIIYGVLRNRKKLDWIISHCSSKKIYSIDFEILCILRIGFFQVVFLNRIPDSAAVNTSVDMAKTVSNKWAAGFVNAVLRKGITKYADIASPDMKKDPAMFLSIEKSMPLWLSKRWIRRYGLTDALKLCDSINTIPFITIRTNTLKSDRDSLMADLSNEAEAVLPAKYAEDGIHLSKPAKNLQEMEAFKRGYFQVQDEAAQIVSLLLDPKPGEIILDACSGLGGKTGHIAQLMKDRGIVFAVDIDKKKLLLLEREMERLGISIVTAKQMDILSSGLCMIHDCSGGNSGVEDIDLKNNDKSVSARDFADKAVFDRVLLDAPCTGLGVLRRNPDSKWTRSLKDVKRLAKRQKAMLLRAADFVKPEGMLVYSVCSCEPEENEEVIDHFLEKRRDFEINLNHALIPDKFGRNMISERGFFKTYPDNHGMDGFFAVSLRRKLIPYQDEF